MCLTSDEKKHWLVFYVNQWALSCSINQSNQQISSSERFRFKRLWGSLVRLKHFMCLTRNRTQIFCWRRDGWNHNDERLMMMMMIVIINPWCLLCFLKLFVCQAKLFSLNIQRLSMTYVQLAPVWTAVVLFWRWVRLTSGVQCVLQRGRGLRGRSLRADSWQGHRRVQWGWTQGIILHLLSIITAFVSLMWKTQQEVALRGKSTAPVCPKHSLFLINQ